MKKYEIPLRIVQGEYTINGICTAHMLYDCMTSQESLEPAPELNDEAFDPNVGADYYFNILGMSLQDRLATLDIEEELEKTPKNYDVALVGAMGDNLDGAKRLMEYLLESDVYKEPVNSDVFESLEGISWEETGRGPTEMLDMSQPDLGEANDKFEQEARKKSRSPDDIIEEVYQMYMDRESPGFPPSEKGVKFILGYYLQSEESDVAFEVGPANDTSVRYDISPDIDILELRNNMRIGYETKGLRREEGIISKNQLYTGLGQALTLLSQPSDAREKAVVTQSYLAYPSIEDHDHDVNKTWLNSFQNTVSETPVGLIEVGLTDYTVIQKADDNPICQSIIDLDWNKADPQGIRHPTNSLVNLARNIKEEL